MDQEKNGADASTIKQNVVSTVLEDGIDFSVVYDNPSWLRRLLGRWNIMELEREYRIFPLTLRPSLLISRILFGMIQIDKTKTITECGIEHMVFNQRKLATIIAIGIRKKEPEKKSWLIQGFIFISTAGRN